ncbi:MAG: FAD-dependent oxidoreductase [Nocardioides sp.]|uniref:FAD-dependent oxidoreductase n=1 Tax=Nocardioides sp. TaxID=35761 RepID=UPI00238CB826|nr:FAD-dependent oxidoreductase [Nocardioides sp.]MDE0775711.1 FAD-dependent oxidoreductase [Nocardioides sp.]
MTYVVTQSCCADASCVIACPVTCIHPTPGEPGFATAEMLYVDAGSCVGCGACATACPVEAIKPDSTLTPEEQPFLAINAEYYECFPHQPRPPLAIVPKQRRLARQGPFRVAVVGAGPAGLYTADDLLTHPEISVDVYDRLPTPYGLVRAGVAPDHQHTKAVEKLFRQIEEQPGFRYFLGVEVGRDVSLAELEEHYDAVVYTVGASADRALAIPGEDLVGSLSATDLVGWYNGHPDKQDLLIDLDTERAVVVGNGNVALDVARILTADPVALETTDIAALPWAALSRSSVREVVVLGRRGPAEAAFTVPELVGLAGLAEAGVIDVAVHAGPGGDLDAIDGDDLRTRLLKDLAARPRTPGRRTVVLRFLTAPLRLVGDDRVTGIEVTGTRLDRDAEGRTVAVPTGQSEVITTGLVLRAVGYRGLPVADLPYDDTTGVVPHDRGRVRPGLYVAGWVKRGPTGFIGSNKGCAQETVARILDDLDSGATTGRGTDDEAIVALVSQRSPHVLGLEGWRAIDAEERRRGERRGRPRAKLVEVDEMLRVAHAGRRPEPTRRGARRPAGDQVGTTSPPRRGYPSVTRLRRGLTRRG